MKIRIACKALAFVGGSLALAGAAHAGDVTGIARRGDIISPNGHGGITATLFEASAVPSFTAWGVLFVLAGLTVLMIRGGKKTLGGGLAAATLIGAASIAYASTIFGTVLTDNDGSYEFIAVPPGIYQVELSDPGYQTATSPAIGVTNNSDEDFGIVTLTRLPTPTPSPTPTPTFPADQLVRRQVGTVGQDVVNAAGKDDAGNLYFAGYSHGDYEGNFNNSPGLKDFFLSKYDADGNHTWSTLDGVLLDDEALGIDVVGSTGDVAVAGFTSGSIHGEVSSGGLDAFAAIYDTTGSREWTRFVGTAGSDFGVDVAFGDNGNVYLTGNTDQNVTLTNQGGFDVFLAAFDSTGTELWRDQVGSLGNDIPFATAVDGNRIYVAGYAGGDYDGQTNAGGNDIFLTKWLDDGTRQWSVLLGGANNDQARAMSIDSAGNIFIFGDTLSSSFASDSNAGASDVLVAYVGADGTLIDGRLEGNSGFQYGRNGTLSVNDDFLIGGSTSDGHNGYPAQGGTDIMVAEFDALGTPGLNFSYGTDSDDQARAVVYMDVNTVVVLGTTDGSLGGPNLGNTDIFVDWWTK